MSRNRSLDMQKLSAIQKQIAELNYRKNHTSHFYAEQHEEIDREIKMLTQEEGILKGKLGHY